MKRLGLTDVKHAVINDARFRELFPELQADFAKVLSNPGCNCNVPIYQKVYEYKDKLKEYFPDRIIQTVEEEKSELSKNHWSILNCHISELEEALNNFHKSGRKQLSVARFEDQVTVIINDLGVVY